MTKEWKNERHEIFKDKLYKKASLPRLELQAALEVFKEENPDLISDDRFDPGIREFKKLSMLNRT